MANTNMGFIPISTIIDEWIEDMQLDRDRLNFNSLLRKATDCRRWFQTVNHLHQKIILTHALPLGKVELPIDLSKIQQISYRVKEGKKDCTTVPMITKWVQHDYFSGADIEIKINCPKCGPKQCNCETPDIDIDVDRIWEQQNWHLQAYSRFAKPSVFGLNKSVYSDKFELMEYAIEPYHAIKYHIPECHNLHIKNGKYKYKFLSPNLLETDLPQGAEVLISYLGDHLDEEGNYMIPDQPDAIDAVKFHLSSRHFLGKYHAELRTEFANAAELFEQKREMAIRLANSELDQVGYNELNSIFKELFNWNDPTRSSNSPYTTHRVGY